MGRGREGKDREGRNKLKRRVQNNYQSPTKHLAYIPQQKMVFDSQESNTLNGARAVRRQSGVDQGGLKQSCPVRK